MREDTNSGPCYRHRCPGTMTLDSDVCFICDYCGMSVEKVLYYQWLHGNADLESEDDYNNFPDYLPVYDEDGNEVGCTSCGAPALKYENGVYFCPVCDQIYSRQEFFDYIGAEPPSQDCLTCTENYPYCKEWCTLYGDGNLF